ncbi:hypothetical protein H7H82_08060 [Mycobacterium heidelbergense]|uniref:Uncharacterized protein n=1 Tax=Mycobacterium heidelbergense TaxID=53376 RepID=A0A1X0DI06_MYCHE|nr:hypothetical protein [Mycobacterium heidelbergense]MCV7050548.1 hypothetical protein [Mycobacterium heidelbergense]ORA71937.1 hypothetical protein BST25_16005 [Mycobacterium heidelbergense]BBZ49337.1 hypothetical protein MHEI_10540 [Mycobacterium heidelbergense]
MTTAFASGLRQENRAEQLESLHRRMAEMSGKMSGHAVVAPADDLPLELTEQALVPRGTVAVLSGARSLLLSMVAAATAAGGNVAIVGQSDIGLLAAVERGADLSRLAVIPDPGTDPVEVAAVLIDGMDLVVLGLGGRRVSQTRARAVVARARTRGCTLLVTDGDWQGAPTRLAARVCGYEITACNRPGFGRISEIRLQISGVCAGKRVIGRARAG